MIEKTRQTHICTPPIKDRVTGVILAGGQGKRMGSQDKGLQTFNGKPMIKQVIDRIAPQVGRLIINANRNTETYQSFGFPVFQDNPIDYSGPLAGFLTGLRHCETPYLLTVPCDTPFVPRELLEKLAFSLESQQADLAVACIRSGNVCQAQPVFSLMKKTVEPSLESYMKNGGRKIADWYLTLTRVEVCFDDKHAFENINTPDDLKKFQHAIPPLEKRL